MKISMIAAMANNNVIGLNNDMPWHLPADFAWFRKHTLGKPILMGRKTYDSIGKPLPERLNIILTRDSSLKITGTEVVTTIDEALQLAKQANADELMITGGAHLYSSILEKADRLYLTLIDADIAGDTYFPDYTQYPWQEQQRSHYAADDKNAYSMTFLVLERIHE